MRILINSPIDIHAEEEYAFGWTCDRGHISIVKYLINYANLINSPIDIHAHDEYAFCWSCENGYLKVVEYLINYANSINSPIDIHDFEEHAFCCSLYGNLCVVEYLVNYTNSINSPIDIKHLSTDQIIILKKIRLKLLFLQLIKCIKTVQLQYVIREKIYRVFDKF